MADLRHPVSLAGRGFLVSRRGGRFGRRSIPLQKAQQDTSDAQGEQSLNPEDLWRRSFESWHRGAGQPSYDRAGADPFRFDDSLGVDPWERWKLRLLNDTEQKLASTATGVRLAVAGNYLYVADGQTLRFTQDITTSGLATWTTVTGTPTADITGLASDGFNVWIACGSSGIYRTTRGSATATQYHGIAAHGIGHVKGRLMVSQDQSIFNVTAPTTAVVNSGKTTLATASAATSLMLTTTNGGVEQPVVAGEMMLVAVAWASTTVTATTPSGWTRVTTRVSADRSLAVFYRIATAYAPTVTMTLVFSAAVDAIGTLTRYENVDTTAPVAAFASEALANASVVRVPSVQALRSGSMLAVAGTTSAGSTSSPFIAPLGWTMQTTFVFNGTRSIGLMSRQIGASASGQVEMTTTDGGQPISGATAGIILAISPDVSTAKNELTALFTHNTGDFTWVGFAEGQGDVYAAGFSGDKSYVYRTQVRPDGTALDVPVVAGALPDGEIVRSIYGYLGLIFIGTDGGLRMATSDANGDLTIGALIETPGPVRCFEGQGRYVWFGYEDFDVSRWAAGTYDGLGRLDLTQQTNPLVPAYASDLMVPTSTGTTEQVQSIVTFQDRQVFSIADAAGASRGVYGPAAAKVATGYLDSGLVTYGIADTKVATYLDVRTEPLVGSLEAYLSTDAGAFASIGTMTTAGATRTAEPLNAGPSRGDTHEVRTRLNRASATDAVGPTLTRLTLRSEPAPSRGRIYQVPLVLSSKLNVVGQEVSTDPAEALAFIEGLFDTQTLVDYREGSTTTKVFVKDYEFVAEHQAAFGDRKAEQGICTVTLKSPGS